KLIVMDVMPILYRGHFALINRPRMTATGINTSSISIFAQIVRDFLQERGATHLALVMDTSPTFRHEKYPEYKAQREKLPEDIAAAIPQAEEFAKIMNIPFLRLDGFEADDLMGTLAAMGEKWGVPTVLVSPDKDIAQLVNENTILHRPSSGGKNAGVDEVYDVAKVCEDWGVQSPKQMIDYLGMAGDASDNIPGFPGVGPKTAIQLIQQYGSMEGVIEHANELKGKLKERVLENIEIARMSRWLAEIRTDAPLDITLDDLKIKDFDEEKLKLFCQKYELAGIYSKLTGHILNTATKSNDVNADASDSPVADPATEAAEDAAPVYDTVSTVPHKYYTITTRKPLEELAAKLNAVACFTFDTETTSVDTRVAKLVGLSVAIKPHEAYYIAIRYPGAPEPVSGPVQGDLFAGFDAHAAKPVQCELFDDFGSFAPSEPQAEAKPVNDSATDEHLTEELVRSILGPCFENPAIAKTGHNIKFDMHILSNIGINVNGPLYDSMIEHYVLDSSSRHGMDALAREYLSYNPIPIVALIGVNGKGKKALTMDQVPLEQVAEYAAEDADISLQLHEKLFAICKESQLLDALDRSENPLIRVLFDMEREGIRVDTNALREYGRELEQELLAIETKIYELAGRSFNISSPIQLSDVLFNVLGLTPSGKTSSGAYSTSEEVLQSLIGHHPIIEQVLEYRTCSKLKSTYVDKLPQCVDPATGRIHTSFNQALTETGRLSSDNPNLQNIPVRSPRGKRIRQAFVARDNEHVLMAADYSQIELRMTAAMSMDESMLEAFRNDTDIHLQTAARVYGVDEANVTKEMRSQAKQVNFGIIYGISAFGLAQRIGTSRTVAAELRNTYFEQFPKIRAFIDNTVEAARKDGYVKTLLGRKRPLRDINSRNATVRAGAERIAVNTPVQGSAADLIKLAMVAVTNRIKEQGLKSRLLLQVHDELVFDVPRNEVEQMRALIDECMTTVVELPIPLKVDIGVGNNWLEAH
ncbi:MAG: DNA polymerase I, partial [Kiritimatiellae bacterium]|nr:DNA polymerase I [Kiritimatiellia bacterium]